MTHMSKKLKSLFEGNSFFRILLTLVLIIVFAGLSKAEIATKQEMRQVCQNWLTKTVLDKGAWSSSSAPKITAEQEIVAGDTVLARYYSISPGGFVLVPTLKEMRPIKAYSETSVLDEKQENGFLQLMREILSERFNLYIKKYGSLEEKQPDDEDAIFAQSQRTIWDTYTASTDEFINSYAIEKSPLEQGGPLLTSSWHQRAPYNNLCPDGDGGRCVVGCVATATAQILNYWQWPYSGVGSHSYTWAGDNSCDGSTPSQVLSADYSDPYDWDHMIDSCDDGCLPEDSSALAELNYEVGVAFDMMYGACGSGSYVTLAASVFPTYFKYSSEISLDYRSEYDLDGWYNLIKGEIDQNRPIQYRIRSHSIVCDGYRDNSGQYEYHMNYGWGGSFTTWFVFDSLYCYWVAPDSVCPANEELAVTHIFPQDKPILSYMGNTVSDTTGNNNGYAEPGESIQLSTTIENLGIAAINTVGQLTTNDAYLSIPTPTVSFADTIPWGGQSQALTSFDISVAGNCPNPHIAELILNLSADGGYSTADTLLLYIGSVPGFSDDAESGQGYWRHANVLPSYNDQWHLETYRNYSGTTSWKVGGSGSSDYTNMLDAGLTTPPFLLPADATFSFWHWMRAEINSNNPSQAWDGGVVLISSGDGNWAQITPGGGYTHTIVDNPASPFAPATPCFSGSFDWKQETFDLSAYSGVVQIRFRFGSDGGVTDEGWYIDDVDVSGNPLFLCGDANGDDGVNLGDVVFIINYVFKSGDAPIPEEAAEVNCDGDVNIADAVYLINYIFKSGPDPCTGCK